MEKIDEISDRNSEISHINVQEDQVSERITSLNNEIEQILLHNPERSVLGMSAIRTFLESFIMIITRDRIRSHLRKKKNNITSTLSLAMIFIRKKIFFVLYKLYFQI